MARYALLCGRCDPAISLVFLFFLLISFTRDVMCEALARVRARIIRNNKKRQSGFDPFPPFLKMKSFDLVFSFLAPREYATKHTAYKDVFRFGFEMIRPAKCPPQHALRRVFSFLSMCSFSAVCVRYNVHGNVHQPRMISAHVLALTARSSVGVQAVAPVFAPLICDSSHVRRLHGRRRAMAPYRKKRR